MKKLLSLLLSAALSLTIISTPLFALENIEAESVPESISEPQSPVEAVVGDLPAEEEASSTEEILPETPIVEEVVPEPEPEAVLEGEIDLAIVPTPDDAGEVIGEETVDSRELVSLFRSMLSSTAITNFTTYGDQLSGMTVSVGSVTINNFGAISKAVYDALNADINSGTSGVSFSKGGGVSVSLTNPGLTTEQISKLARYIGVASYYAVDWDNPAMFFSNGSVSFKWAMSGTTITVTVTPGISNEFQTLSTRQSIKTRIDAKVAEIVSAANSAASNTYDKVKYFNDWLCANNAYNTAAANAGSPKNYGSAMPWSSASGFLSGADSGIKGPVCEGYARAMQTLCAASGITCTILIGSNHMWNNIKVDGTWYGNDTTWNDTTGTSKYLMIASLNNSRGHTVEGVANEGIYFSYPDLGTATDPTKVLLDKSEIALSVGETEKLTAEVLPTDSGNQAVTWVSSNTSVAKISSDGTVTAVDKGTAIITVKTSNGLSAACTVTVDGDVEAFVERLYTVALGRKSDALGKASWVNGLKNGTMTGAHVARGCLLSDEMKSRNLSDTDFVNILYKVFLDRAPDAQGFNNWLDCLQNGLSREYVVAGCANSDEFKMLCGRYQITQGSISPTQPRDMDRELTTVVNRLYKTLLGRDGEEPGLNDWCTALLTNSKTPKRVAYGFVFSDEFTGKNYSNADFVEHMYAAFLGRASDAQGKENWMNHLNAGHTRQEVFNGFADSDEFAAIAAQFGL
ncbi:MAG: DUF4214 domain-containing protein [Clostridia bacterium]|nr:DUF4214 domain-containing protein [Clostridia bacterium]